MVFGRCVALAAKGAELAIGYLTSVEFFLVGALGAFKWHLC
jgi:hypothetical protein